MRNWVGVALCAVAVGSTCVASCLRQEVWPGPRAAPSARAGSPSPPPPIAPAVVTSHPRGGHPRILMTPDRIAALRRSRAANGSAWRRLDERCQEVSRETVDSGYEAWDWANATLDLAVCSAAAPRADYAAASIRYFRALLDDRNKVGDGAGGDDVVHHDDGYSIRTRGCFGAIAYDWLHDTPGMTPDLRVHAVDRLSAWTKWFAENGYNRDQPIANYYMGWFGAVAFAGIAVDGDDGRSGGFLTQAQRMIGREIAPAYNGKLGGGDFPEGWQYGDMVGAILAIFGDAESETTEGRTAIDDLSWLRETVAYRVHALWPDGKHTFDTGDWSEKPAVAPAHALEALATVLRAGDADQSRALWLARTAEDPHEEWLWLAALADDPARIAEDPRHGATSYLARGTGVVTARTDWSSQAVWVGLTSGPSLSDHQHLDAGHFEIVRGGDALVIDAGGYGSYSSLSHNVIAVDDKKDNDNYAPNQGTWSDAARIARFEDTGTFVYALADYASAYNPAGYPSDHPQRSVVRAEREFIFSRAPVDATAASARVVVYDRITVAKPSYSVTFLLHGGSAPELQGSSVHFSAGKSAAFVTTLLPVTATPVFVREPTELGDGPYYANEPPEGSLSVRVEVRSPLGDLERRFLHAFVATQAATTPPPAIRIDGRDVDGAAIEDEAYVFSRAGVQARAAPIAYRAPAAALRHVVASLPPGARYTVTVERDGTLCSVSLEPAAASAARVASSAGLLTFELAPSCAIR